MEINEDDINQEMQQYELEISKRVAVASKWLWGLSNFKNFISKFLLTENNEDQWTFDYESWLLHINPEKYEHPAIWAQDFYRERWDKKEMDDFMIDLESTLNTKE